MRDYTVNQLLTRLVNQKDFEMRQSGVRYFSIPKLLFSFNITEAESELILKVSLALFDLDEQNANDSEKHEFVKNITRQAFFLKIWDESSAHNITKILSDQLCHRLALECTNMDQDSMNKKLLELAKPAKYFTPLELYRRFLPDEICWQVNETSKYFNWCRYGFRKSFSRDHKTFIPVLDYINNHLTRDTITELVLTLQAERSYHFLTASMLYHIFITMKTVIGHPDLPKAMTMLDFMTADLSPTLVQSNHFFNDYKVKACLHEEENNSTYCDQIKREMIKIFEENQDLLAKIINVSMVADAHFSDDSTHPLIPLCSYGRPKNKLKMCQDFMPSKVVPMRHNCFTFNRDGQVQEKVNKVGPGKGLTFLIEDNFGKDDKNGIFKLVIHEPEVAPDLRHFYDSYVSVPLGQSLFVSLKPTITTTTKDFDRMSFNKRKCILPSDQQIERPYGYKYHQVHCFTEAIVKYAIEKCNCTPWFLLDMFSGHRICEYFGYQCYKTKITEQSQQRDSYLKEKCQPSCSQIYYSPTVANQNRLLEAMAWDGHADVLDDYIYFGIRDPMNNNKTWGKINPFLVGGPKLNMTPEEYKSQRFSKFALVNINFLEPQATVITKDAKVTFADMLGNIGGTFGIFLGLSTIGLVDIIVTGYSSFKKYLSKMLKILEK